MSEQLKHAKGPLWKKILWWCLGLLGVSGALALLIFAVVARKKPKTTVSDVVKNVQHRVDLVDIEAKARVARAEGIELAVLDQIKAAAEIRDPRRRLQALATALTEDY